MRRTKDICTFPFCRSVAAARFDFYGFKEQACGLHQTAMVEILKAYKHAAQLALDAMRDKSEPKNPT